MNISENIATCFGFWKPSSGFDLKVVDGVCLTGYKLEFGCFHPIVFIYNLLECAFYAQQTVISN